MRRGLLLLLLAACDGGDQTAVDAAAAEDASSEVPDASEDAGERDAGLDGGADAGLFEEVVVDLEGPAPELLSAYRFFRREEGAFVYNDRVVPYDLNTPLFSDYATKDRAIYVPTSTAIVYRPRDAFVLPVGSVIIKSFSFPPRIVETRLLIRYPDGWRPFVYVWREDQSDAELWLRGRVEAITFTDPFGDERTAQYLIPQRNQCFECHEEVDGEGERTTVIIGPKARHLHRTFTYDGVEKNQLQHLADLGMLAGLPALDTIEPAFSFGSLAVTGTSALGTVTLEKAARDYLDINCAYCHSPRATSGVTSQLFLDFDSTDRFRLGVCKAPGSAGTGTGGRRFDIVPGDPNGSILWYRVQTEIVGDMMPLLGRSLRDRWGAELIWGWIANMPPESCE